MAVARLLVSSNGSQAASSRVAGVSGSEIVQFGQNAGALNNSKQTALARALDTDSSSISRAAMVAAHAAALLVSVSDTVAICKKYRFPMGDGGHTIIQFG